MLIIYRGTATADALALNLPFYMTVELLQIDYVGRDDAIKRAFLNLDQEIMTLATDAVRGPSSLAQGIAETRAAYAGSCALLALYDAGRKELKVASK